MSELRTPTEWCLEMGVRIEEPWGWDEGDDTRAYTEPVTKAEFCERMWWSRSFISLPTGGEIEVEGLTNQHLRGRSA